MKVFVSNLRKADKIGKDKYRAEEGGTGYFRNVGGSPQFFIGDNPGEGELAGGSLQGAINQGAIKEDPSQPGGGDAGQGTDYPVSHDDLAGVEERNPGVLNALGAAAQKFKEAQSKTGLEQEILQDDGNDLLQDYEIWEDDDLGDVYESAYRDPDYFLEQLSSFQGGVDSINDLSDAQAAFDSVLGKVERDHSTDSYSLTVPFDEMNEHEQNIVTAMSLFTSGLHDVVRSLDMADLEDYDDDMSFNGPKNPDGSKVEVSMAPAGFVKSHMMMTELASKPWTGTEPLYRGMSLPASVVDSLSDGDEMNLGGISSWSESNEIATGFSNGAGKNVILSMVPKTGSGIKDVSEFYSEEEVLTGGRARVKSKKVVENPDTGKEEVHIELEHIETPKPDYKALRKLKPEWLQEAGVDMDKVNKGVGMGILDSFLKRIPKQNEEVDQEERDVPPHIQELERMFQKPHRTEEFERNERAKAGRLQSPESQPFSKSFELVEIECLEPMASGFSVIVEKGAKHKYLKRELISEKPRRYKYWYRHPAGGLVSEGSLKVGSKFRYGTGKKMGHFEITAYDKDTGKVTVKHDETGKTKDFTVDELRAAIHGGKHGLEKQHGYETPSQKYKRLKQEYAQSQKTGSKKQQKKILQELNDFIASYKEASGVAAGVAKQKQKEAKAKKKPKQEPKKVKAEKPKPKAKPKPKSKQEKKNDKVIAEKKASLGISSKSKDPQPFASGKKLSTSLELKKVRKGDFLTGIDNGKTVLIKRLGPAFYEVDGFGKAIPGKFMTRTTMLHRFGSLRYHGGEIPDKLKKKQNKDSKGFTVAEAKAHFDAIEEGTFISAFINGETVLFKKTSANGYSEHSKDGTNLDAKHNNTPATVNMLLATYGKASVLGKFVPKSIAQQIDKERANQGGKIGGMTLNEVDAAYKSLWKKRKQTLNYNHKMTKQEKVIKRSLDLWTGANVATVRDPSLYNPAKAQGVTRQEYETANKVMSYLVAQKMPKRTILRGIGVDNDVLAALKPGEEFDFRTFASFSTSDMVADNFTTAGGAGANKVIIEMTTDVGLPIDDLSVFPSEKEIAVGGKAEIVSFTKSKYGASRMVLRHIPPTFEKSMVELLEEAGLMMKGKSKLQEAMDAAFNQPLSERRREDRVVDETSARLFIDEEVDEEGDDSDDEDDDFGKSFELVRIEELPEIPSGFTVFVEKGAKHKYLKRELVSEKPRRYKYWYRHPAGGLVQEGSLKVGSKFRHGSGDKMGHFEITAYDKDTGKVTVKHDETGKTKDFTVAELKEAIHGGTHGLESRQGVETPKDKHARLKKELAQAKKTGSEKQQRRIMKELEDFGASYFGEKKESGEKDGGSGKAGRSKEDMEFITSMMDMPMDLLESVSDKVFNSAMEAAKKIKEIRDKDKAKKEKEQKLIAEAHAKKEKLYGKDWMDKEDDFIVGLDEEEYEDSEEVFAQRARDNLNVDNYHVDAIADVLDTMVLAFEGEDKGKAFFSELDDLVELAEELVDEHKRKKKKPADSKLNARVKAFMEKHEVHEDSAFQDMNDPDRTSTTWASRNTKVKPKKSKAKKQSKKKDPPKPKSNAPSPQNKASIRDEVMSFIGRYSDDGYRDLEMSSDGKRLEGSMRDWDLPKDPPSMSEYAGWGDSDYGDEDEDYEEYSPARDEWYQQANDIANKHKDRLKSWLDGEGLSKYIKRIDVYHGDKNYFDITVTFND